jgi:hypothetical protein
MNKSIKTKTYILLTEAINNNRFTNDFDEIYEGLVEAIIKDHLYQNCPLACKSKTDSGLRWTGKQVELVELIYALKETGSINGGEATIKEICNFFSELLQISITDLYRYFIDITRRTKGDRTIFLDKMKKVLIKKLEEIDRRPSMK